MPSVYLSQFRTRSMSLNICPQISQAPYQTFSSEYIQRLWLLTHGKQHFVNFSQDALKSLRKYFNSLDENNNGSIGVQELEDPFIAFGLSDSREEVEQLIKSVDFDGSGKIQFDQFLEIMLTIKRSQKKGDGNTKSALFDFFQKLSHGTLQSYDKNMSFRMNVSQYRRKKLLQSIMSKDRQKKQNGTRIMLNFRKQIENTEEMNQQLKQSKKSNIYSEGLKNKHSKYKKKIMEEVQQKQQDQKKQIHQQLNRLRRNVKLGKL